MTATATSGRISPERSSSSGPTLISERLGSNPWALARLRWGLRARTATQCPHPTAPVTVFQGGRGVGKTRSGAEAVSEHCRTTPKARVALVGRSFTDAASTMVEGAGSGLLSVLPASVVEAWNRSLGELRLQGGALVRCYGATEPDRLRGPQFTFAWCDEAAAWPAITAEATWDTLRLACRIGRHPQVYVTTTPRPTPLYKRIVGEPGTVVRREATRANLENLAPTFAAEVLARYAGSRLGRQELEAELLDDVEGALWRLADLDATRVVVAPDLIRIVVAVDPAGGAGEGHDETGIVVAGRAADGTRYVVADRSGRHGSPEWARQAIRVYHEAKADRIVAERNFGGDMVEATIRSIDPGVPVSVVDASRGKRQRAEPIAAAYEQGRIRHVGTFPELEDQMASWVPGCGWSPDRLDALVWACTELGEQDSITAFLRSLEPLGA